MPVGDRVRGLDSGDRMVRLMPDGFHRGAKIGSMAKHSAGTPATVALTRAKVAHTLHPYEHDAGNTHFGDEAVAATGQMPERVFKTLLVSCQGSKERLGVAVVPVSTQLDLKAVASALGAKKAAMADPSEAEKITGYVVGGISPLGQKKKLPTVLDASAMVYPSIFVSGGRRGLQVELSPDDLVFLTQAKVADIGR